MVEKKSYAKVLREQNPTTWGMIHDSGSSTRYQRRKDSTILVEHVHGGTDGAVYGA